MSENELTSAISWCEIFLWHYLNCADKNGINIIEEYISDG
jgi:hypothetical protein